MVQWVTTSENEWYNDWQGMTTSDNEWQQELQRIATSDNEWYNEWQHVIQRVTTNDNEWQRMATNENEYQKMIKWQQMTANDETNDFILCFKMKQKVYFLNNFIQFFMQYIPTWPTCRNSPWKCTPVKYKARLPIVSNWIPTKLLPRVSNFT